jgi:hypothetical protein
MQTRLAGFQLDQIQKGVAFMHSHRPFDTPLPSKNWLNELKRNPLSYQVLNSKTFINKKIKLADWTCFLHHDHYLSKHELMRVVKQQRRHTPRTRISTASMEWTVHIDSHAYERWTERISPCPSLSLLRIRLQQLLHLGRITLSPKGWGFIDQDILFGYKIIDDKLIIQTFLGRVSLVPALNNYKAVRRFISTQHDRLDLTIAPHVLNQQHPPLIPKERVQFSGNRNRYVLEEYAFTLPNGRLSTIFLLETIKEYNSSFQLIDPTNPHGPKLFRSVLYFLLEQGYQEFVLEHVLYHKQEAFLTAFNKRLAEGELKHIV